MSDKLLAAIRGRKPHSAAGEPDQLRLGDPLRVPDTARAAGPAEADSIRD